MHPEIEIPNNVPRFQLRFDFAVEAGFLDHTRELVIATAAEAICRRNPKEPFTDEQVQKLNALSRNYTYRRFFLFCGLVALKESEPRPWIWDGCHWFKVAEEAGLFRDMLNRLAATLGRPADSPPIIYPPRQSSPAAYWTYPNWAVLHDTRQSLAALLPYPTAKAFLRFNE